MWQLLRKILLFPLQNHGMSWELVTLFRWWNFHRLKLQCKCGLSSVMCGDIFGAFIYWDSVNFGGSTSIDVFLFKSSVNYAICICLLKTTFYLILMHCQRTFLIPLHLCYSSAFLLDFIFILCHLPVTLALELEFCDLVALTLLVGSECTSTPVTSSHPSVNINRSVTALAS